MLQVVLAYMVTSSKINLEKKTNLVLTARPIWTGLECLFIIGVKPLMPQLQQNLSAIGAVCSGSKPFASILNSSVMLGNYLQQTTSADDIFRCIFLGALRVKRS